MEDEPPLDLSRFKISAAPTKVPARSSGRAAVVHQRGEFLKGPIPIAWLKQAAALPGKALHVGLAVWFEHGRRKKNTFVLSAAVLQRFEVGRKAGYAGLAALEDIGLLHVVRRHGKNPSVTLLLKPKTPAEQKSAAEEGSDTL